MKTHLLFCLAVFVMVLGFKNASAASYTWTGSGSDSNWSNSANWSAGSSIPGSGDDVIIPNTSNLPTVDVTSACNSLTITGTTTLTLSAALTVTGGLTINGGVSFTTAGASTASFGGASTINGTFTIGATNAITFTSNLSIATAGILANNGSMTVTTATLSIAGGGSINNSGSIITQTNSSVTTTGSPCTITNNVGSSFNAFSTTFSFADGLSITNTGGAFSISSSSTMTNTGSLTILNQNSGGTSGTFSLDNSSITTAGILSITNTGLFTAQNNSTITFPSATTGLSGITNSGTFYAGVSGSACIINFNTSYGAITNSGNFYLGSTSVINVGAGSVTNIGSSTFTIRSDVNGSGAFGPITTGTVSGIYNVERYLTGHRGYRLISSPVYAGTAGGNNIYSLNYLYNNLYLTGTGGVAGGFTAYGNPTLYIYDEGFAPQYSTFLNSNFIGISSISGGTGASPTYSVNTNGAGLTSSYSLPAGAGFLCFFRGNLSEGASNLTNSSFTALSATAVATGTLNTGQITFTEWYNGSAYLGSSNIGGPTAENFSLIGNPYPSAIDLGTIPTATTSSGIYATPFDSGTSTGITSFIYELNGITGNYEVYNVANPTFSTSGASRYIASGQGFFVQAYGSSCQFIFNESGKADTIPNPTINNGLMVTKRTLAAINPVNAKPVIRLKLALGTVNNEETLIAFNPSAQTQYVINEDAPHKTGTGVLSLATYSSDNLQLAINSMPLQKNQSVNLNVTAQSDGLYTLNMSQLQQLPAIYDVWLMDAYKKDSLDIKHNPTYSFDIINSDAASFGAKRFSLVIRQNPALAVHLLNFTATKATTGSEVVWKTENEENYTNFTVERSTDGGVTFAALGGFASSALGTYSLLDKNPSPIVDQYRLKIQDLNGAITYSNVVTLMYANTGTVAINNISVYPNPASSTINLSVSQSTVTDKVLVTKPVNPVYNITITNYAGAVIKTATSAQTSWQDDVSSLLPGAYLIQVVNANDKSVVGKTKFVKL